MNSLKVRLPQVLDWLARERPEVLALQETKVADEQFPLEQFEGSGYRTAFSGQKTYNGVALLSRDPAHGLERELPGLDDPQRRVLAATVGRVRLFNVYVPNGQSVGSEKYSYKLEWLEALRAAVVQELARHPRLVVLGDFNIAPEDRDVHDPREWEGEILCSEPERAAYRRLLEAGLVDTFRLFEQAEGQFSWWDYRMNAFRRNRGLRIDLILAGEGLAGLCSACRIDAQPRGWDRPSDHAPVVAEFAL